MYFQQKLIFHQAAGTVATGMCIGEKVFCAILNRREAIFYSGVIHIQKKLIYPFDLVESHFILYPFRWGLISL